MLSQSYAQPPSMLTGKGGMGIRQNMLGESYLVKRMTILSKGGTRALQSLKNGL